MKNELDGKHEWMTEVLHDLKKYAQCNDLPSTSSALHDLGTILMQEIEKNIKPTTTDKCDINVVHMPFR